MTPKDFLTTFSAQDVDYGLRQRFKHNRRLATGLLALMGGIFIGTHLVRDPSFATMLVRASSEAGIAGGLADWFAVTALFRRPLGLPIPHTAIIPASKDRIGRTLGRFVERHFLTQDVILQKLRDAHPARRQAEWLATPENARIAAASIVATFPYIIRSFEQQDLHDFARRTLGEQLRRADIAPVLGRALHLLTASGEADVLFERILAVAERWLEEHRDHIDRIVKEHSRWWIPATIDRRIAGAIVSGTAGLLQSLRQPDSEVRTKFHDALSNLVNELTASPEQHEQINASKNRILDHQELQAWVASVWQEAAAAALEDLSHPDSKTRAALESACLLLGRALATDETMLKHVDSVLEQLSVHLISWRSEIANFIAEVVRSWDSGTLVERLELIVGSDLQYIRMNGTLVGACAGCFIYVGSRLLF